MIAKANETHDPRRRSWVESANDPATDFPIQNLPFGVFRRRGAEEEPRVGVAIGDQILDIADCRSGGLFIGPTFTAAISCEVGSLNPLMSLGAEQWSLLRHRIGELLCADNRESGRTRPIVERSLVPMSAADMLLPADIGDYTDFWASIHHATNVGTLTLSDGPLRPNYRFVPVACHGRASSVVISGTGIRRPVGQTKHGQSDVPAFGPTRQLDYQLEVGFFIGPGNAWGVPIEMTSAEGHIFGLCMVNGWSARDIETWEHEPLGPFLARNFATTISPWIVSLEALVPFRVPASGRSVDDPSPLPHLDSTEDQSAGAIDITLEAFVRSRRMRDDGMKPFKVSRGRFTDIYWTIAQMLVHHTSNGCNVRPGDMVASGTVSGHGEDSRGCLLERTWRGTEPLELPTGEERRFLEDGDEVIFHGFCEREGSARIGFGECRGVVEPATAP